MVGSLFLAGAVYFTLFGGEYSMLELHGIKQDRGLEEQRLAQVLLETAALEAWADSLENDPATIERLARERWGLIRPGERLYRFEDELPMQTPTQVDGQ